MRDPSVVRVLRCEFHKGEGQTGFDPPVWRESHEVVVDPRGGIFVEYHAVRYDEYASREAERAALAARVERAEARLRAATTTSPCLCGVLRPYLREGVKCWRCRVDAALKEGSTRE